MKKAICKFTGCLRDLTSTFFENIYLQMLNGSGIYKIMVQE